MSCVPKLELGNEEPLALPLHSCGFVLLTFRFFAGHEEFEH